jgi:hypothetical protein
MSNLGISNFGISNALVVTGLIVFAFGAAVVVSAMTLVLALLGLFAWEFLLGLAARRARHHISFAPPPNAAQTLGRGPSDNLYNVSFGALQ